MCRSFKKLQGDDGSRIPFRCWMPSLLIVSSLLRRFEVFLSIFYGCPCLIKTEGLHRTSKVHSGRSNARDLLLFSRSTANTVPMVKPIGSAGGMATVNKSNPRVPMTWVGTWSSIRRKIMMAKPMHSKCVFGWVFEYRRGKRHTQSRRINRFPASLGLDLKASNPKARRWLW